MKNQEIEKLGKKGRQRSLIIFFIYLFSASFPLAFRLMTNVPYSLDEYLVPFIAEGTAFVYFAIMLMQFKLIRILENAAETVLDEVDAENDSSPKLTEEDISYFINKEEKTNSI